MAQTAIVNETSMPESLPRDYAWNAAAFIMDVGFFKIAMSLVSSTTVLPALIATLTGSELIVGIASGITSGAWLLPQLFVAGAVAGLQRKKPIVVNVAFATRPIMFLIGLAVLLWGAKAPAWATVSVLFGVFLFFVFDAVVSVPWFDLLAETIPVTRRGRVIGMSEIVGGIGGIAAGVVVRFVLGSDCPLEFPANYAMLFGLGGLMVMLSAVALAQIREPVSESASNDPPTVRQVIASMPKILFGDREFLRVVIVKLLAGAVAVANAFYVLYGTRKLGFGLQATGLFVSAQVAGSLASGLVMGIVQDRWGPRTHIRLVVLLTAMSPLVALLARALQPVLDGPFLCYYYLLVFFSLGISTGSMGWPFYNWILEHAQEQQRPVYIGLINTLGAVVMIAPPIGGWVVASFSYPAVFVLALAFSLLSFVLSLGITDTRAASRA